MKRPLFALALPSSLAASEILAFIIVPPTMRVWYPAMVAFHASLVTSCMWIVFGPSRAVKR